MAFCPKSHVPVGVRRSSNGEEFGTVPGPNRSSRSDGQPADRGHLEATTVRAFLVSSGCPKAGITEEAHLHCRQCGCGSPNSKPRQTKRNDAVIALFHHRMSFRVKSAPPKAGVTAVALMHTLSPLKRHISRMGE